MSRLGPVALAALLLAPLGAAAFGQAAGSDGGGGRLAVDGHTVRGHCSVCHSYELVEAQRLDRANWEWVMDDMIDKYGATWIDPGLREAIVDYLVEHQGPER